MMIDPARIAEVLTERYGLPLRGESAKQAEGVSVRLVPSEVAHTQGFAIGVLVGWRSVTVEFLPGSFASTLVGEMERAMPQQRAAFTTFAEACRRDGGVIEFSINGVTADPIRSGEWPRGWRTVSIRLSRSPLVVNHGDSIALEDLAVVWGGRMLGLALSLLPVEQAVEGEEEGGVVRIEVNRYERSSINRAACIALHGAACTICGFDFGQMYGANGEGFIEVHHLEPVSGLAPGTVVDPGRDLVPVCSNCHSIIHRRTPPYSPDEVRAMLSAAGGYRDASQ